ncbi:MAG: hypothetical protein LBF16_03195 [Pseudomonadales bacterium]|jgi:hypothetical protein|nr:hypothetical protein [Pseudomonadales bacterium]
MPPTLRLLQRMQRTLALWLRPAEPGPQARDLNLRTTPLPEQVELHQGQLPPRLPPDPNAERLRRWRERQQRSRAGPWQMK